MTHRRRLRPLALGPLVGGAGWLLIHRRSPAVRAWRRSLLPTTRAGRLFTRTGGEGQLGVLLIHGLVATGDIFTATADELAIHHRVAVPDLLGFWRSLDKSATEFGTDAHLEALRIVIDEVLGDRPLLIGAHSMGCTLALRLALQMPERVVRLICVGAPIWSDPRAAVGAAGPMARTFLLNERLAAQLCRWNCRHRRASGWLAAVIAWRWPVPIARQASLHTWPAYHQTMEQQVLEVDWSTLLASVGNQGLRVTLAWGSDDTIGDPTYAQHIIEDLDTIDIQIIPETDHTAPVTRPELLAAWLRGEIPVPTPPRKR